MYGGTVKDRRKRVNCMCSGACPGVGATMLTCESNSGPKDEGRYPSENSKFSVVVFNESTWIIQKCKSFFNQSLSLHCEYFSSSLLYIIISSLIICG